MSSPQSGAAYVDVDTGMETRSLTESVRGHSIEHGLRYHAYHSGRYPFPNDQDEQDKDELFHHLVYKLHGNRFFQAPVGDKLESGGQVIDLGTGTGTWCTEMADEYPSTAFIGVDLSPIQSECVPPNVQFVVDDIEHDDGWDEPKDKFDYIHMRQTIFSLRDQKTLLKNAYKHLKPGGWIEIQEVEYRPQLASGDQGTQTRLDDFYELVHQGLTNLGYNLYNIDDTAPLLEECGYRDIHNEKTLCPIGDWKEEDEVLQHCGTMLRNTLSYGIVGMSRKALIEGMDWTLIQIEMFLIEVRQAIKSESERYLPFRTIYAQKPE